MQITILAGFVVVLMLRETAQVEQKLPFWLAGGGYVLGSVLLSWLGSAVPLRTMGRGLHASSLAVRRDILVGLFHQMWIAGGLGLAIWAGYGWWVWDRLGLRGVPLLSFLAAAAPLLAVAPLHWLLDYPLQRELRRRFIDRQTEAGMAPRPPWTRKDYFLFRLRHDLLMVAIPLALVLSWSDCIEMYAKPLWPPAWSEGAAMAVSLAGALAILSVAPWLIVRAWGARSLPAGPLRDALTELRKRCGARLGRLLIWPTGANVANAAVLGVLRPWRYVLLTDALIRYTDGRDVEAVFCHEVRHVRAHHLFYMMMLIVSTAALCTLAGGGLVWLAERVAGGALTLSQEHRGAAEQTAVLVLLAATVGLVFGWVSRRFERQCDVFAAWMMGPHRSGPGGRRISPEGAAAYSWALQRIVQINCGSLERHNWRHGSIARRLEYLMRLSASGGTIDQVDREVGRIKLGIWAAAILAVGLSALAFAFWS